MPAPSAIEQSEERKTSADGTIPGTKNPVAEGQKTAETNVAEEERESDTQEDGTTTEDAIEQGKKTAKANLAKDKKAQKLANQ